jgi:hypothetical protein
VIQGVLARVGDEQVLENHRCHSPTTS